MAHLASAHDIKVYAELKEVEKAETARLAEKAGKLKDFLRAQEEAEAAEAADEEERQRRREERARKREARKRESDTGTPVDSRTSSRGTGTAPSSEAGDSVPPSPRPVTPEVTPPPARSTPPPASPDILSVEEREELAQMAASVKARRSQSDRDRLSALGEMLLLSDMSTTSMSTVSSASSGLASSVRTASELSEPETLRVAVLGVPDLTRRRVLPGIFGVTRCAIAAVADPTAEAEAAHEAESFRISPFAGSAVSDLIDSKDNNALAVTRDSLASADDLVRALRAGKPVLTGPFASCETQEQLNKVAEAEVSALTTAAAGGASLRPVVRCLPLREESLTLRATVTRALKDKAGTLLFVEGSLADGKFLAADEEVESTRADPTDSFVALLELVRSYTNLVPSTLSAVSHHGGRLALATGTLRDSAASVSVPLSLRVSTGLVGHLAGDKVTLAGTKATIVVDLAAGEVLVGESTDRTLYPTFLRHDAWRVEEAWTDEARGDEVAEEAVALALDDARANLVARDTVCAALTAAADGGPPASVAVATPTSLSSGASSRAAEAAIKVLVAEKAALQQELEEARAAASATASSVAHADAHRADDLADRRRAFTDLISSAQAQLDAHSSAVSSLRADLARLG
jgi:hypothetical protein